MTRRETNQESHNELFYEPLVTAYTVGKKEEGKGARERNRERD